MISTIARVIFFSSLAVIFYVIVGHGLLLAFLRFFISRPVKRKPITPQVCFIIPAFNEEGVIKAKLDNTLALDYPVDKLRIVVISDGSIDKTDDIVAQLALTEPRIELLRMPERGGRTVGINKAAELNRAEVYAISDANVTLEASALKELVANFADSTVGAVTARFVGPEKHLNPVAKGVIGYWNYEQVFRKLESDIFSLSFISGWFHGVRGSLLAPAAADVTHDHSIPVEVVEKGFRSVFEPRSILFEQPAPQPRQEVEIKVRTFHMGMNFLRDLPGMITFRRHPWFCLNLFFRKILRWFTPVFLLLAFISGVLLVPRIPSTVYILMIGVGIILTFLVLILKKSPKWLSTVAFFFLSQWGLLWGLMEFLCGKRIVYWKPSR